MAVTGPVARAGFFAAVLILAVAVGTVATGESSSAPTVNEVDAPSFNSDEAVAPVPEQSGDLSMSADADETVVVIDAGHGADISREQLSPLVSTLTENGATVKYHVGERQGGRPLNRSLSEADAFITFGAQQRYTERELNGLAAFSDAGGRVLLLNEPEQATPGGMVLFGPAPGPGGVTEPMAPLGSQHGLAFHNGYLYNMHQYDTNYRSIYATPTGNGGLGDGVDRAVFHSARPVSGGETVVRATEQTTLSETRRQDTYGIVARSGNVVAVGDTDVVSQEFLYRGDNEKLVGNLLDFLVSGEKSPANVPQPSPPVQPGPGEPLPPGAPGGDGGSAPPPEPEPTPEPDPTPTPED